MRLGNAVAQKKRAAGAIPVESKRLAIAVELEQSVGPTHFEVGFELADIICVADAARHKAGKASDECWLGNLDSNQD
ncbi:hypothetical protein [Mesorhizobium erdmanii]|uniref:hypothetical protein n=1 Tax=Mesorhizobium erdmanii TaxID=1777866 RepID=UPI000412A129|nr:hypothetical protein [Mesorhizobium erdmanii]